MRTLWFPEMRPRVCILLFYWSPLHPHDCFFFFLSPLLVLFVAFLASLRLLFFTAFTQRQSRLKFPVLMITRQARKKHSLIIHANEEGTMDGGAFLFPRKRRSSTSSRCFHPSFLVPYVSSRRKVPLAHLPLIFCSWFPQNANSILFFSTNTLLFLHCLTICDPWYPYTNDASTALPSLPSSSFIRDSGFQVSNCDCDRDRRSWIQNARSIFSWKEKLLQWESPSKCIIVIYIELE
jgi:hypothetical protein